MSCLTLLRVTLVIGMAVVPLSAINAQLPSCSVKEPNTGRDCLSATLVARSTHSDGAVNHTYKVTNICDRSFDLTMDTGNGETKRQAWWINKREPSGPKESFYNCVSGYHGKGDCQNIGWTYDCLQ